MLNQRGGAIRRRIISQRRDEMQHNVGNDAVVEFKMRRGSRPAVGGLGVLRTDVKLPVLVVHRLRVVGGKGRPGECRQ